MVKQLELNDYKQAIAESYDRRSQTYDDSEWHVQICHRLIEYSQVSSGQTVLDIGTGTGHLAIAAAQIVGDRGDFRLKISDCRFNSNLKSKICNLQLPGWLA